MLDDEDIKKQGQLLALEVLAVAAIRRLPDRGAGLLDVAELLLEAVNDADAPPVEQAVGRELVLRAAYARLDAIRHAAGPGAD